MLQRQKTTQALGSSDKAQLTCHEWQSRHPSASKFTTVARDDVDPDFVGRVWTRQVITLTTIQQIQSYPDNSNDGKQLERIRYTCVTYTQPKAQGVYIIGAQSPTNHIQTGFNMHYLRRAAVPRKLGVCLTMRKTSQHLSRYRRPHQQYILSLEATWRIIPQHHVTQQISVILISVTEPRVLNTSKFIGIQ